MSRYLARSPPWASATCFGPFVPLVLQLEFLKSLGGFGLHAAVLLAPAVDRRLADAQLLADLTNGGPAVELGIGLTQLGE